MRAVSLLFFLVPSLVFAKSVEPQFFTHSFGKNSGRGEVISAQRDGFVIAGTVASSTQQSLFLIRINGQGNLDPSFGDRGVSIHHYDGRVSVHGLQILPDGKIIVGGFLKKRGRSDFMLARFDKMGFPDFHFGEHGFILDRMEGSSEIHYLALDLAERIVVGGYLRHKGQHDFVIARYLSEGRPDTTFGKDGKLIEDLGPDDRIFGLAVAPDGKIVVAGLVQSLETGDDCAVARYSSRGERDKNFGENGLVILNSGPLQDICSSVAVSMAGDVIAAGFSKKSAVDTDFFVARLKANGQADSSFGKGGIVKTDFHAGIDVAHAVEIEKNGQIILGGEASQRFALARYSPEGHLLSSQSLLKPAGHAAAEGMTLDRGGRVVLVGHSQRELFVVTVP